MPPTSSQAFDKKRAQASRLILPKQTAKMAVPLFDQWAWGAYLRPAPRARRVRLRRKQPNQSNPTTWRLAAMNMAKPGFFLAQVVGESMNRRVSWSHRSIRLEPDSMDYNFKPLTLDPRTVNKLRALGEFVGIIN